MSRYTFYAYIDGYDLQLIEPIVRPDFEEFIASRNWVCGGTKLVNERETAVTKKGDLPRWDFGIAFDLPEDWQVKEGWFADVEDSCVFLRGISEKTGREFVGGVYDNGQKYAFEMFFIDSGPIPIERIRRSLFMS